MSKISILITVLSLVLVPTVFMGVNDSAAASPTAGIYYFYGRVMNQQDKPVGNCNVVLVKSLIEKDTVYEAGEPKKKVTKTVNDEEVVDPGERGHPQSRRRRSTLLQSHVMQSLCKTRTLISLVVLSE